MRYACAVKISDVDLRLLATVEAIHRLGSITSAASELGLSQPAVSHALRRLRQTFDDPLFVRTPTGVTATPRGAQLAASARRIQSVVTAELVPSHKFEPGQVERTVELCMTDVGEMVMLPRLLHRMRREAPGIDVRTRTLPPDEVTEALDSGVVNLAVGPFPELARSPLPRQRLYQRGYLCLTARDQPAVNRLGLTVEVYLGEPHLRVHSIGRTEDVFDRFLAENGMDRRVALSVPNMLCVPSVTRQTDLIATVPQSVGTLFANYPGVSVYPVPFTDPIAPPSTTISQYWSDRFASDPVNLWLRAMVSDIFAEPSLGQPVTDSDSMSGPAQTPVS